MEGTVKLLKNSCLAVLILVSMPVRATCPDLKTQLAHLVATPEFERLNQFGVDTKKGPVKFATLNHRTGEWSVFRWEAGVDEFEPVRFDRDDSGIPLINLSRRERGVFLLTNTTPPLYTVSKATTLDDIPELKNLKEILQKFANLAIEVVKPGPGALASVVDNVTIRLAPTDDDIKALRDAIIEADQEVSRVMADKNATIRFLQYAEFAEISTAPDPIKANGRVTALRAAFDNVSETRKTLLASEYAEQHSCQAARALVESMKDIDWFDAAVVDAKRSEIKAKIEATPCGDSAQAAAKDALFDQTTVTSYLLNIEKFDGMIDLADQALAQEAAAIENAAAIRSIFGAVAAVEPCKYVEGMVMATSPDQIAFDKTGLVKVTLTPANALGHTFKRRAADEPIEVSYRTMNPTAGNIGYGVGIIYTPLSNPTFGAVENPANKEEKVIARIGEESRAGELALLGTYRFGTPGAMFRPGIQFGAGLSEDLATFVGVSFDFGSIFRLGAGLTGQHVHKLSAGQSAMKLNADGAPDPGSLTKVSADTDIQRSNTLKTGLYLSLSISLDGISFFNRPTGAEEEE